MATSQLSQLRDLLAKGGAGLLYLQGESWWERLLATAYKRPYHLAGFYCPSTARGKQEILVLLYSPNGYATVTLDVLVNDPLVTRLALAPLKDPRMEPAFRTTVADIASVRITPKEYLYSLIGYGKMYSRDIFRALESKLGPCVLSLAIPHDALHSLTLEEYQCNLFCEPTEVSLPPRQPTTGNDPLRTLGPLFIEEFLDKPAFREEVLRHIQPTDVAVLQTRFLAAHQRLASLWAYLDGALQTGVMDLSQLSLLLDKTNQERMPSLPALTLHDCPLSNLCLSGAIIVPQACHHADRVIVSKSEEEYDARLSLVAQVKRLVDDVDASGTPILYLNDLIRCCNVLFGAKIPRVMQEKSCPALLVVTQASTRDIQLSLREGGEIVLPSHHADLSGMTLSQLQEILRYLDAVAECDRRFDTLRLQVADEIGKRSHVA